MKWLRIALLALLAGPVAAEDAYQLLRADPTGYARMDPDRPLVFPADHGPHPEHRIEWWYLTANLRDGDGRLWGLHWTLFRQSMTPADDPGGWASNQVWMAHAALSTPDGHHYAERFARGGIGQAGVELDDAGFDAWLDDWHWSGPEPSPLPGKLALAFEGFELELALTADTPWVRQGEGGFHRKSDQGQASYYYSQPHIHAEGRLTTPDGELELTGPAWLDREWSSQPLAPNQPGWDWLSLHFDDGTGLMVYRLRREEGEDAVSGTWIEADGRARTLDGDAIELSAESDTRVALPGGGHKTLPLTWTLALPGAGEQWRITAPRPDSWLDTLFPYWEGPIEARGSRDGVGYLELTGY